ncbi:MAG: hypothetical protein ACJ71T_17015 [Actinomycetales bacterium]
MRNEGLAVRHRVGLALATALVMGSVVATPGQPGAVAAAAAVAPVSHPGVFHAIAPARFLYTTAPAGATVTFTAVGKYGIPASGVGAVVVNLTVASPQRGGYLTAYPFGTTRPRTSNLNFTTGHTVPNLAVVPVGSGGKISLYNSSAGSARLIADISGYYESGTPTDPGALQSLAPARILDTAIDLGAPASSAAARHTASVAVAGQGGVPATGVSAVVMNVTAAAPQASGYLTTFPTGTTRPVTSTLNFPAGRTVANLTALKLGAGGSVDFYNGSDGSVRLVADVFGYVLGGSATRSGTFVPLSPQRIMDTRTGLGIAQAIPAHGTRLLDVNAKGGLPPYGGAAVALNVTVTGTTSSGYLTVSRQAQLNPLTSNLNFTAHQTVANMVIVRPDDDGHIAFINGSANSISVIADVSGSYIPWPAVHFRGSENISTLVGTATAVSCASSTFCMVGTDRATGTVLTRTAAGWSSPVTLQLGPIVDISCVSSTFCVAIDWGFAQVFNGSSWSPPVEIGQDLKFIGCLTTTFCVAADRGRSATYNGTTWSSAGDTSDSPNAFPPVAESYTCPSSTYCAVMRFDGSTDEWTGTPGAQWVPAAPVTMVEPHMGCASSSFCVAADDNGDVATRDATTWSANTHIALSADNFTSVICRSSTFCLVTGQYSPNAYTYDGEAWTQTASDAINLGLVSCASTDFCLAVEGHTAVVGRGT